MEDPSVEQEGQSCNIKPAPPSVIDESLKGSTYLKIKTSVQGRLQLNSAAVPFNGVYIDANVVANNRSSEVSILIDSGASRSLLSKGMYDIYQRM